MSLGDMTWLKAIATTVGIFAYGVIVAVAVGFYFSRQDKKENQRDADQERAAKSAAASPAVPTDGSPASR